MVFPTTVCPSPHTYSNSGYCASRDPGGQRAHILYDMSTLAVALSYVFLYKHTGLKMLYTVADILYALFTDLNPGDPNMTAIMFSASLFLKGTWARGRFSRKTSLCLLQ